jgi:hypothetical protein
MEAKHKVPVIAANTALSSARRISATSSQRFCTASPYRRSAWISPAGSPPGKGHWLKDEYNVMRTLIIPAIGAVKLRQLTSLHIQRMYNDTKTPRPGQAV